MLRELGEVRVVDLMAMAGAFLLDVRHPSKQTSDRVSRAAAKLMRMRELGYRFTCRPADKDTGIVSLDVTEQVAAVAGSAMSQDQTKGKRAPDRKKKGARK